LSDSPGGPAQSAISLLINVPAKEKANFRRPLYRQQGYKLGENWSDWPELANARVIEKARLSKAARLLANLSDEEKRQFIEKSK